MKYTMVRSIYRQTLTLSVDITDVDPRPVPYNRTGAVYLPDRLVVAYSNDGPPNISLGGSKLKKDSTPSVVKTVEPFGWMNPAPEWVKAFVEDRRPMWSAEA